MGNIHKSIEDELKGDTYIGVCSQALENTWAPVKIRYIADYCKG